MLQGENYTTYTVFILYAVLMEPLLLYISKNLYLFKRKEHNAIYKFNEFDLIFFVCLNLRSKVIFSCRITVMNHFYLASRAFTKDLSKWEQKCLDFSSLLLHNLMKVYKTCPLSALSVFINTSSFIRPIWTCGYLLFTMNKS